MPGTQCMVYLGGGFNDLLWECSTQNLWEKIPNVTTPPPGIMIHLAPPI